MFMLFNAGLHWWLAAFCGDFEVIKFGINSAHPWLLDIETNFAKVWTLFW